MSVNNMFSPEQMSPEMQRLQLQQALAQQISAKPQQGQGGGNVGLSVLNGAASPIVSAMVQKALMSKQSQLLAKMNAQNQSLPDGVLQTPMVQQ